MSDWQQMENSNFANAPTPLDELDKRTSQRCFGSEDGNGYRRCVIYTRKSSEEGLEQDFNSLDAQREACAAYVQSQRREGWRLLRYGHHTYDDGGISGGTMLRDGLQRLLSSIERGEVDVVVVYKVDRPTRSLADFARIVDVFDRHNVSFVSVTQSFNTTSSMGRLTLNVLLSFAQFEREVTAERIRDKIAASKRKGIWMGGPVPLGYRVKDRKLMINDAEAKIVQIIFETYLKTNSIPRTKAKLDDLGMITRKSVRKSGKAVGGIRFSVSGVSAILKNPVYIGLTSHKGELFNGEHDGLIEEAVFHKVRQHLSASSGGNKVQSGDQKHDHLRPGRLFKGMIFDSAGFPMTTTHTNKKGVRHNYYVSVALAQNRKAEAGVPHRVPAARLEKAVLTALQDHDNLTTKIDQTVENAINTIERVDISSYGAVVLLKPKGREQPIKLDVDICWKSSARRQRITPSRSSEALINLRKERSNSEARTKLLQAIARADRWYQDIKSNKVSSIAELAIREKRSIRSVRLNLKLAWLAPDIIKAVMTGQLAANISATELANALPTDWNQQRVILGMV